MVKIKHGLANLNSNNSFVYGQILIKYVYSFSWDQNWADLVKLSVLQQNRLHTRNAA